jgi:hypothetical protein
VFEVLLVVLQEHFSGILVQSTLSERNDQEALNNFKDVVERPGCGVPIFFESVHTDLAFFGDVRMEYLGDEIA